MSEQADIVARMRAHAAAWDPPYSSACEQAADEIERLHSELKASHEIADMVQEAIGDEPGRPARSIPPMNFDTAIRQLKARVEKAESALATAEAAALERAAKVIDEYGSERDQYAREYACETAADVAALIREIIPTDYVPAPRQDTQAEALAASLYEARSAMARANAAIHQHLGWDSSHPHVAVLVNAITNVNETLAAWQKAKRGA